MKYFGHIFLLIIILISLAFSQNIFESYTTNESIYAKGQIEQAGQWDEYKGTNELVYDASNLEKIYYENPNDEKDKTEIEKIDEKIKEIKENPLFSDESIYDLNENLEDSLNDLKQDPDNEELLKNYEKIQISLNLKRQLDHYENVKKVQLKMGKYLSENTNMSSKTHLVKNPNDLRYKTTNFIPVYEDSVFLSRTSDISHSKPILDSSNMLAGFCSFDKANKFKIEKQCSTLDKNVCASTDCCVLLGGLKCIGGDASGPNMRSHYNDINIPKKDHYYHKGKCYGNCL